MSLLLEKFLGDDAAMQHVDEESTDEVLLFGLGKLELSLPVEVVSEILEASDPRPIPRAPKHILGMISVRAKEVAVLDLGSKLGVTTKLDRSDARFVVVEAKLEDDDYLIALKVDHVDGVVDVSGEGNQALPRCGGTWNSGLITGVANVGDRKAVILDIAGILATDGDLKLLKRLKRK